MKALLPVGLLFGALTLLDGCTPPGPTTTAYDGLYRGQATVADPGLPCQQLGTLNPMRVSGGHVDFGNLTGWVQQNGQVNLVFGQVYLVGQFQGTHFSGQIINPQPACNFNLSMDKVG